MKQNMMVLFTSTAVLQFAMVSLGHTKDCLTFDQARKQWPGVYLKWRGQHCWFNPGESRMLRRPRPQVIAKEQPKTSERPVGQTGFFGLEEQSKTSELPVAQMEPEAKPLTQSAAEEQSKTSELPVAQTESEPKPLTQSAGEEQSKTSELPIAQTESEQKPLTQLAAKPLTQSDAEEQSKTSELFVAQIEPEPNPLTQSDAEEQSKTSEHPVAQTYFVITFLFTIVLFLCSFVLRRP